MDAGSRAGSSLFNDCFFAIVVSQGLTSNQAAEVSRVSSILALSSMLIVLQTKKTLEDHGGEAIQIRVDSDVDVNSITHIISSTTDFIQYPVARDSMIPVVMPGWITQSLLRNKQAQVRPHNPDPRLIFSNVTLTCADIPTGDKDAIIGAVLVMGGMESSSFTKLTTHVCALTADHPKSKEALTKYPKCKVVLPHW